eukprot:scaffold20007_cov102-Isochrysis_galbana.AAC.2
MANTCRSPRRVGPQRRGPGAEGLREGGFHFSQGIDCTALCPCGRKSSAAHRRMAPPTHPTPLHHHPYPPSPLPTITLTHHHPYPPSSPLPTITLTHPHPTPPPDEAARPSGMDLPWPRLDFHPDENGPLFWSHACPPARFRPFCDQSAF